MHDLVWEMEGMHCASSTKWMVEAICHSLSSPSTADMLWGITEGKSEESHASGTSMQAEIGWRMSVQLGQQHELVAGAFRAAQSHIICSNATMILLSNSALD